MDKELYDAIQAGNIRIVKMHTDLDNVNYLEAYIQAYINGHMPIIRYTHDKVNKKFYDTYTHLVSVPLYVFKFLIEELELFDIKKLEMMIIWHFYQFKMPIKNFQYILKLNIHYNDLILHAISTNDADVFQCLCHKNNVTYNTIYETTHIYKHNDLDPHLVLFNCNFSNRNLYDSEI